LYQEDNNGAIKVIIYVDDCNMIGIAKGFHELVKKFKASGLTVTINKNTNNYLSWEIVSTRIKQKHAMVSLT
jgi:hypothetical protein